MREKRIAFEHARIAVGGLLARRALVDQRNGDPALGELQRDRRADDTRAEHDHLRTSHGEASRMTAHMYATRSTAASMADIPHGWPFSIARLRRLPGWDATALPLWLSQCLSASPCRRSARCCGRIFPKR